MDLQTFDLRFHVGDDHFHFQSPGVLTVSGRPPLRLSIAGWRALRAALHLLPEDPAPVELPAPPERTSERARRWFPDEEARLVAAFSAGDEPADIGRALGRTRTAVLARLVRLGHLDEAAAGLRYPVNQGLTKVSST